MKYCGVLGTTGYSLSAKQYLYSLFIHGVDLTFQNIDLGVSYKATNSALDTIQSKLLNRPIQYDIVIMHCVPDTWPSIIQSEKRKNRNVLIVGLTVWETSEIPSRWRECVDQVSFIFSNISNGNYPFKAVKNYLLKDV